MAKWTEEQKSEAIKAGFVRFERLCWLLLASVLLTLSSAVGVAIGNGIPMAKSASAAMQAGMQAGMVKAAANCGCSAAKAAGMPERQSVQQAALMPVPLPTAAGQTLEKRGDGTFSVRDGAEVVPSGVPDAAAVLETMPTRPARVEASKKEGG